MVTSRRMYYRLSNTASREQVENMLGRPFRYPNLYQPKPVINGLEETILPVITMAEPREITYAIWGMLPEHYEEDWDQFQNVFNTLNLSLESLQTGMWYSKALESRRCLIIASGFFTYYIKDGQMFPYYVHHESGDPLCLGGIYNQLEDGFVTCGLIISKENAFVGKIQNIDRGMPLILSPEIRESWLDSRASRGSILKYVNDPDTSGLTAHPITKKFCKTGKKEGKILAPVFYQELPFAP